MNEGILDKLRKLHALSKAAGTEAEAANAAARLQELLLKHNLEIGALELGQEEGTEQAADRSCFRHDHHMLARCCDVLFQVRSFQSRFKGKRRGRMIFVGLRANVEVACLTYAYLVESVEALLDGWKRLPKEGCLFPDRSTADYNAFRVGAASRIFDMALAHMRIIKERGTGAELIHLGNSVAQRMFEAHNVVNRVVNRDHGDVDKKRLDALQAGYEQGGRVDIHGARSNKMLRGPADQ